MPKNQSNHLVATCVNREMSGRAVELAREGLHCKDNPKEYELYIVIMATRPYEMILDYIASSKLRKLRIRKVVSR